MEKYLESLLSPSKTVHCGSFAPRSQGQDPWTGRTFNYQASGLNFLKEIEII